MNKEERLESAEKILSKEISLSYPERHDLANAITEHFNKYAPKDELRELFSDFLNKYYIKKDFEDSYAMIRPLLNLR